MIFRSWLRLAFWLVLSLVFLGVPNLDLAHAATCTADETGNWSAAATWSCGRAPTTADTAVIASPYTVTVDANTAATQGITIDSGGTLIEDGGGWTIGSTGGWTNNGTFTAGSSTVNIYNTYGGSITGTTTFYNLIFSGNENNTKTIYSDLIVENDLTISRTYDYAGYLIVSYGSEVHNIEVRGDAIYTGNLGLEPDLHVIMNGSGPQNISTSGTINGRFGSLRISNTTSTVTMTNDVRLSGSLTIDEGTTLDTTTGNYTLTIGSSFTRNGTFLQRQGTVIFGDSSGTITGTTTFYNLAFGGSTSGAKTLDDDLVVENDFSFTRTYSYASAFFRAVTGETHTISVAGDVSLSSNNPIDSTITIVMDGTTSQTVSTTGSTSYGYIHSLEIANTSAIVSQGSNLYVSSTTIRTGATLDATVNNYNIKVQGKWTNYGTFEPRQGTFTYTANNSTITGTTTFYNLTFASTGYQANSINSDLTVENDLNITSGYTDNRNVLNGSINIYVSGNISHTGNAAMSGYLTIVMNGTGTQTVGVSGTGGGGNSRLGSLQISNTTNTVSLSAELRLSGQLIIDENAVLDVTDNNYNIKFLYTNVQNNWTDNGTFVPRQGMVYTNSYGTIYSPTTFYDLNFSNSIHFGYYVAADLTVLNDLTFNPIYNDGRILISGAGGVTYDIEVAGDVAHTGTAAVATTINVVMNGTTTQTIGSATTTSKFGSLQISNTAAEVVLSNPLRITGNVTIDTGATLNLAGYDPVGASGKIITNNGTLKLTGDETFTFLAPTNNSGSAIEYTATTSTRALKDWTYRNLTINGAGGTFTLPGAKTLTGSLTITAGTLDATENNYNLTVAGDWSNTGTFIPQQSTVTLNGGGQDVNGSTEFYNLTKATTTADTLTFQAGQTQTITGTLTLTGALNQLLSLRSSIEDTQWLINPSGSWTISYVDVQDSNNTSGEPIPLAANNITDSGNNTGWGLPPDPPTNLVATAGASQVSLTWSAPVDTGDSVLTDYVIDYKLTTEESWTTFADGVSTVASTTVTGLTNGEVYNFRVSAASVYGAGSVSDSATATPVTIPNAPTNVTAESGNAQAIVSFSAPADDGGSAITGYTVTSDPGSHTGTGSSSPITVTGLTNGTSYTFTVTATNAIGTGSASAPSATTTPATVPDAPTSLQATAGAGQVALTWSAPVWNGGAAITDYVVDYKPATDESWATFADGVSVTASTTVTGLDNGTTYHFRVSAANSAGQGSASDTAVATPVTIPDAPTGVVATRGNTQASVSFSAPADDGGSAITGYTVTSDPGSHTGTGAASPITVTGLTNGTSYTFTVTATNAVGTGPASEASAAVTPATVPDAPTSVSAEGGNAEATVSFSAPADNGGDTITNYYAAASPGGAVGTASSSPITVTGLTPGATYTFTVIAENAVGTGASSTASGAITLPTVPGAPANLAATVLGSSIALAWSAPADNGGAAVTDYVIEYQLSVGGEWAVFADGQSASTTATVIGLANDNSYDFRVSAVNLVGQGSASATKSAAPGEPAQVIINSFTNLIVPTITASVRLTNEGGANYEYQYTWCVTDASDNYCGGGNDVTSASAAKLINAGDNFDTTLSATVSTPDDYWFHLSVTYGSETSTASQSFTAIAGIPDAPTTVAATAGNGQVVVSFTAPASNHGSTITGYTATANPGGATGTGSSSPLTVTSLTNGTGYTFTVTATNAIGTSAASTPSATTTPVGVPGAPTGLSATAGEGEVTLTWTAPTNHGGATTTDYIVEYKLSSAATWSVFADGESATESATVTGLSAGTAYDFRISAVNTAGQGDPSTTASATTESEAVAIASGSSGASGWVNLWQTITEIIRPTPTIGPAIPTEDTATVVASDQNQTSPSSISTGQFDESATEFGSAETGIVRFIAETKPATEDQPFQLDSKFKIIIVVVSIMLLLAGLWRLVFPFLFRTK